MTPAMQKSSPKPTRFRELLLTIAGLLLVAGGLYWFYADQISLTGQVVGAAIPVKSSISGTVSRIPVQKGQLARKGDPLLFLKDEAQRDALELELQALGRVEAAVPPHLLASLAEPDLENRLLLARQAEDEALRFVGQASAAEAGAAVAARRINQFGKEDENAPGNRETLLAHERAKRVLEQARAEYEAKSLARAAMAAELQELRAAARSAGLNLRGYTEQRARVRAAEAALEATVLPAPEDGFVAEIKADPEAVLAAGQTALLFLPLTASPEVAAFVSEKTAAHLAPGQRCLIRVSSVSDPLEGAVASLSPRPSGPGDGENTEEENILVRILLDPADGSAGGSPFPLLPDGAAAVVTIHLR
jgi:multidrug resistance efflux pump